MKRVTIKDIAKIAGVSRGTVDRVINNRGNVSKKVEENILMIAKKLGYEKNIIASRLASSKVFKVAVVCPDPKSDIFWKIPKDGMISAFDKVKYYGIHIEYFDFNIFDKKSFVTKLSNAIDSKPDAIILAPLFLKESREYLDKGQDANIPFITINSEIDHPNVLAFIGQSSYHSGYLAGKLLNINLKENDEVIVLNLAHKISNAPHYSDKVDGINKYFLDNSSKNIKVHRYEIDNFSRSYKLMQLLTNDELKSLSIIGFDMIEPNVKLLKEDKLDFIINQNAYNQGYNGIMNFIDYFLLKINIDKKQYLPLDIVVKENVDFYIK